MGAIKPYPEKFYFVFFLPVIEYFLDLLDDIFIFGGCVVDKTSGISLHTLLMIFDHPLYWEVQYRQIEQCTLPGIRGYLSPFKVIRRTTIDFGLDFSALHN